MRSRLPTAQDLQRKVYINGLAGKSAKIPFDYQTLRSKAERRLSPEAFAYIDGGAGQEHSIRQNRSDFNQWQIRPHMLRGAAQRDTQTAIYDLDVPAPLFLCPIGVLELAHPKADLAVAEACAKTGIPMIFSNQASFPMEACAKILGSTPYWFQLYYSSRPTLVKSFVQRAEACGCKGIIVTLDTALLGWRNRDLNQAYLPFLSGRGIAQYTSDPVFRQLMEEVDLEEGPQVKPPLSPKTLSNILGLMRRFPGSFFQNLRSKTPLKAVRLFVNTYSNAALQWEDIERLRDYTDLPILLKGILHPADAHKALSIGVDGIVVSNHGGRQIDGSISAIQALPEIVSIVDRQVPVLMDSGIRTGSDVFKALALGADTVCLGRPYVYGLALDGANGVQTIIENLIAELELTMALAGCHQIEDIQREMLVG